MPGRISQKSGEGVNFKTEFQKQSLKKSMDQFWKKSLTDFLRIP